MDPENNQFAPGQSVRPSITRTTLTKFYQKHDPSKANDAHIDNVLAHKAQTSALELFKALQQRYGACNELLQPEQSDPELRATFISTRSNTSITQEHVVQLDKRPSSSHELPTTTYTMRQSEDCSDTEAAPRIKVTLKPYKFYDDPLGSTNRILVLCHAFNAY